MGLKNQGFIKDFSKIYEEFSKKASLLEGEERENFQIALKCLKNIVEELKNVEKLDELRTERLKKLMIKHIEREVM
ncbi:MAG: hypothetical protein ACTSWE_08235 [Promethearchaeota archaeon]